MAARKAARLTHHYYDDRWLRPEPAGTLCSLRRFDSDPAAMAELLEQCVDVGIEKFKDGFAVSLSIDGQTWKEGTAATLSAAVAEAWLKARGKSGE